MKLRSMLAVAASAATAGLMFAAPASAATQNWPDGYVQYVMPQAATEYTQYWNINSNGTLYAGTTQLHGGDWATTYFTKQNAVEIEFQDPGSPYNNLCLGWDADAGVFNLRSSAPCTTSANWDLWQAGSNNTWSELSTIDLWQQGVCAWYDGEGVDVYVSGCNGSTNWDRWTFHDQYAE